MRRTSLVGALALSVLLVLGIGPASAEQRRPPTIVPDRNDLRAGDRVVVTLTGFRARVVTITVCGNLARRGSSDCNVLGGQSVGLASDSPSTRTELLVSDAPVPCPCALRAANESNDEVAVTPFVLVGAPIAAVNEPDVAASPLVVELEVARAPAGLVSNVRSALGGPTTYDVTVVVRNRSVDTIEDVKVSGAVGRTAGDDLAVLHVPPLGAMGPGQINRRMAKVTVPAPSFGSIVWTATATGGNGAARAAARTRSTPVLLNAFVLLLVADVGVIAARRISRRPRARGRRRVQTAAPPAVGDPLLAR